MLLWEQKAKQLRNSAIILLKSEKIDETLNLGRTPLLLMGLSLENLLKGIIIKSGKYPIENGELPSIIGKHNLIELCRDAEIIFKDNYFEKTFLQRLSEQVDWAGKYPTPKKATNLINSKYGSKKAFVGNEDDLKFFLEFYEKIYAVFKK